MGNCVPEPSRVSADSPRQNIAYPAASFCAGINFGMAVYSGIDRNWPLCALNVIGVLWGLWNARGLR